MEKFLSGSQLPAKRYPSGLRSAIEQLLDGKLAVDIHCQPIVDLRRGVLAGYEALARFPKEIGLAPDACLEAADSFGLRMEVEDLLAKSSIAQYSLLPQNCFLTVNLSPAYIMSEHWNRLLSKSPSFAGMVFEITEQDVIRDYDAMRNQIARIRHVGASLAVDDTGSGYASLKHVIELRPDFIKLDRLFVDGCHLDPAKVALIDLLGETASRLDAWIIAEGIENQPELEELLRLDVPLGQGYFLGRPQLKMNPLDQNVSEVMRARRLALAGARSIANHAVPCPTAKSVTIAIQMLQSQPGLETVVIVDRWGRPIEFAERHPVAGVRHVRSLLRAQAASESEEVLKRALTRSVSECFDPIASVTEQGMLQGLVRVDRLMRGILDHRAQDALLRAESLQQAQEAIACDATLPIQ
jgi:EAL domain-containing protein (putative c-di-GMP-specific phosphodiesterase class I)